MICPHCGGSEVRQITPGFYECEGLVAVGGIPASATGLPHHIPDLQPCGARFQVGTAVPAASCALCGLDSIGTCEDCRRRLCGRHGTTDTPFLCRDCRDRRAASREEGEAEDRARSAVEEARDRSALEAVLTTSDDPAEVAKALREHEAIADPHQCAAAWSRLIGSLSLKPTHDRIEVAGRSAHPLDRRGRWQEEDRLGVWLARNVEDERVGASIDLFIDEGGYQWRSSRAEAILWTDPGERRRCQFMLPRGQAFETVREEGHLLVPGSTGVEQGYALQEQAGSRVGATSRFIRAVVTILGG